MPFGLQGAPGTFQRMMDRVTHGMEEEFVAAYLDDLSHLGGAPLPHLPNFATPAKHWADSEGKKVPVWNETVFVSGSPC